MNKVDARVRRIVELEGALREMLEYFAPPSYLTDEGGKVHRDWLEAKRVADKARALLQHK